MDTISAVSREWFAFSGLVYAIAVAVVGLPVMYTAYVFISELLGALGMGNFVASSAGFSLLVVAFLIGMWLAGTVAKRFLGYWTAN